MSTTTKEIILLEDKGNYFAETIDLVVGNDSTICEQIIFTTDSDFTDTHSVTARHKQPTIVLIKGRL